MGKLQYTEDEHITPDSLLQLFKDEDGKFYYLSKQYHNISTCSTKKACVQEDTYETKRDLGKGEEYVLRNGTEDELSPNENKWISLFKKIIQICDNPDNKNALILHTKEKDLLAEFVVNLHTRNPERLEYYYSENYGELKDSKFGSELEELKRTIPNEPMTKMLDGAVELSLKKEILLPTGDENGCFDMFVSDLRSKGSFCILKSNTDDFAISDNIGGIGEDDCMYIPINPRYAIGVSWDKIFKDNGSHNHLCLADEEMMFQIHKNVVKEAKEYIYGREETLNKIKSVLF